MTAPLLRLDDLSVHIGGKPILQHLSFAVGAGEILALVGQSGSGKSTTALAITRLLSPGSRVEGTIWLGSENIAAKTERQMQRIRGLDIGLVFQEPMTALNPVMTIGDQIIEAVLAHRKLNRRERAPAARRLLGRVGLSDVPRDRYPHELSGGQRQRVAIAIALASAPKLIIADEPSTALDVTTQDQILKLFKNVVQEEKIGLILITHDLAVVAEVADRVAVLDGGQIVETGLVHDVLRQPQHATTKALVGAVSRLPPRPLSPAVAAAEPILEVQNLVRHYGQRTKFTALKGISFSLNAGESLGVVGESGSGKSTLLRAVLGLDKPDSGSIRIASASLFGAATTERLRLRRKIQAVFQDPSASFDPRYTVERIIAEPLHLLGTSLSAKERRYKVEAVLENVGLPGSFADRLPHEFSGGQRQRIALARALIIAPSLIVLDEPLSALDLAARTSIIALLNTVSREFGISYLFVTHDLSQVGAITDRLIVLKQGEILESGATEELLRAPRHPYTQALLAATPDFDRALS